MRAYWRALKLWLWSENGLSEGLQEFGLAVTEEALHVFDATLGVGERHHHAPATLGSSVSANLAALPNS